MTAQHYIDVELDDDGDALSTHFICTGGPDDTCRQWCAEGCEEYCSMVHVCDDDPETGCPEPCPRDGDEHRWEDTGSCREMDWLGAVGWQDSGWVDEPDAGGEREVTSTDLRSGRHLIETEWTGDDYIWRYPAQVAQ